MCLTPRPEGQQHAVPLAAERKSPVLKHHGLSIKEEMSGSILITGGLGFLGSVVLESLLRSCPQVRQSTNRTHRHSLLCVRASLSACLHTLSLADTGLTPSMLLRWHQHAASCSQPALQLPSTMEYSCSSQEWAAPWQQRSVHDF